MGSVAVPYDTVSAVGVVLTDAASWEEALSGGGGGYGNAGPDSTLTVTGTVAIPGGGVAYAIQASCSAKDGPGAGIAGMTLSVLSPLSASTSDPALSEFSFQSYYTTASGTVASATVSFRYQSTGAQSHVDTLGAVVLYNMAPAAPSGLAPASGSVTATLIPTFTGSHVDADGSSTMNAVEIEVRDNVTSALKWASGMLSDTGSTFSQPYAGPALYDGTAYKWRARTRDNSGASNAVGAWSAYIPFTANENDAPTALQTSPVHNAQVGTLTPTFVIGFSDPDVGDKFNAYQIQVRRNSDAVSFWDTGQVATTAGQKTAGSATVVYSGTALVNSTEYEWRVRVQDLFSTWSAYSSWLDFTPALVPGPPAGLTPSGLQNTLTPTVAGTYVVGAGAAESDYQYQVRQSGITIYSSGDITTNIATGQAYGTNNPADTPSSPPALAWGTAYEVRARSKDTLGAYGDWTAWQAFNTNAAPTTPTGITPSNGQITPDTTPAIAWTHNDPDGDAQTQADIELYDVTTAAYVAGYNPKTLTQSTLTHDVTPALTLNRTYRLRIRTKGLAGPGFGTWSSPLEFIVANAPVVTMTEPDPGDTVTSSATLVTWTLTGGSGTQQDFQVRLYASDAATVLYDSGVQAGTATSWTIPAGAILNGSTYYVSVAVHDTLAQLGQSGQVVFSAAFTPPATITGLAVVTVGDQADG